MLRAIQIDRYRGVPRCVAQGLGRVNLVIGKNDCGKTAFMEALELADEAENAAHILVYWQQHRLGRTTRGHDFERFWRPMFFGCDAKAGFSISVERDDGTSQVIEVRQDTGASPIVPEDSVDDVRIDMEVTRVEHEPIEAPIWVVEVSRTGYDRTRSRQQIYATPKRLRLPRFVRGGGGAWIHSGTTVGENEIKYVSQVMQRGQDRALTELLRTVDARVSGVQLLAPGGDVHSPRAWPADAAAALDGRSGSALLRDRSGRGGA